MRADVWIAAGVCKDVMASPVVWNVRKVVALLMEYCTVELHDPVRGAVVSSQFMCPYCIMT